MSLYICVPGKYRLQKIRASIHICALEASTFKFSHLECSPKNSLHALKSQKFSKLCVISKSKLRAASNSNIRLKQFFEKFKPRWSRNSVTGVRSSKYFRVVLEHKNIRKQTMHTTNYVCKFIFKGGSSRFEMEWRQFRQLLPLYIVELKIASSACVN